jgi:hypothetical protein
MSQIEKFKFLEKQHLDQQKAQKYPSLTSLPKTTTSSRIIFYFFFLAKIIHICE